jgi:hypothetical protein
MHGMNPLEIRLFGAMRVERGEQVTAFQRHIGRAPRRRRWTTRVETVIHRWRRLDSPLLRKPDGSGPAPGASARA